MMRFVQVAPFIIITLVAAMGVAPEVYGQSGGITGTVIDAETDTPIPDANVVVYGDEERVGASTDADGSYHIARLVPGTYTVQVTAIGYHPAEEHVEVGEVQARTVSFALEPQAYDLNEIVVRGQEAREATSATVQRVAGADIVRQDPTSVAEVARLIPGAHVQTNSRGQTLLYLRDAGERQVAQFFDGALLNVPWDNRVDIGVLPAAMMEGVTVSKGVPSVRYGTNVIGGAVNFQSRSLDQPGHLTEARSGIGTAGARRMALTHVGRRGALGYTGSFEYSHQDDFALPEGAALPFSQRDGSFRTNTDRRLVNGFLRGTYRLENGARFGASLFHVDAEKGVAPESHVDPALQPGDVRYWRYPVWRTSMLILNGEIPLEAGATLRGAVWGSRFEQRIDQYRSAAYQTLGETQSDVDLTGGLRVIWEQPFEVGRLTTVVNALTTRHHQTNVPYDAGRPASDSVIVYRQHIGSVGVEYDVRPIERLEVRLGASLDGSVSADIGPWAEVDTLSLASGDLSTAVSVTAGLMYRLDENLFWKATVGRKPRFPTMRERFGGALGKFLPNPNLKPVTGYLAESGFVWQGTRVSGEVVTFMNRTFDAIDKITLPSGIDQRINLDGSRIYGIEFAGAASPFERLSLDGHLTWMRPRGLRGGRWEKLSEKPTWLGTLTATYDLPFGLTFMGQSEYTAGTYARCTSGTSSFCSGRNVFVELPDALIIDVRLSRFVLMQKPRLAGEVFLRLNNATDELRLLQLGLPDAGRSFEAGIGLTF